MINLFAGNANQLYPNVIQEIKDRGIEVPVRGTKTKELIHCCIELEDTHEPLVTSYGRLVNVTFALAEVLWILIGHQDVDFIAHYNESIKQFSDDGIKFNAAYGYRLRNAHGYDQIEDVIRTLEDDPYSRRATLCIWHPDDRGWTRFLAEPQPINKKDRACNVLSHLLIRDNKLDWLQVIRSNDAVLGVPYNWIQWTHIQQEIANRLGLPTGNFVYFADSLHVYLDTYYDEDSTENIKFFNLYTELDQQRYLHSHLTWREAYDVVLAIRSNPDKWREILAPLAVEIGYWDSIMPLFVAHEFYKNKRLSALEITQILMRAHTAFGAAQIKFYYTKRWHNLPIKEREDLMAYLRENYPTPVLMWMLNATKQ